MEEKKSSHLDILESVGSGEDLIVTKALKVTANDDRNEYEIIDLAWQNYAGIFWDSKRRAISSDDEKLFQNLTQHFQVDDILKRIKEELIRYEETLYIRCPDRQYLHAARMYAALLATKVVDDERDYRKKGKRNSEVTSWWLRFVYRAGNDTILKEDDSPTSAESLRNKCLEMLKKEEWLPCTRICDKEMSELMEEFLLKRNDHQKEILKQYGAGKTQTQIAQYQEISCGRVGQIIEKEKRRLLAYLRQAYHKPSQSAETRDKISQFVYVGAAEAKKEIHETTVNEVYFKKVSELELSVRTAYVLLNSNINIVGALLMRTEAEMLKCKNFGRKSLKEVKEILEELGLSLGMKFSPEISAIITEINKESA